MMPFEDYEHPAAEISMAKAREKCTRTPNKHRKMNGRWELQGQPGSTLSSQQRVCSVDKRHATRQPGPALGSGYETSTKVLMNPTSCP